MGRRRTTAAILPDRPDHTRPVWPPQSGLAGWWRAMESRFPSNSRATAGNSGADRPWFVNNALISIDSRVRPRVPARTTVYFMDHSAMGHALTWHEVPLTKSQTSGASGAPPMPAREASNSGAGQSVSAAPAARMAGARAPDPAESSRPDRRRAPGGTADEAPDPAKPSPWYHDNNTATRSG